MLAIEKNQFDDLKNKIDLSKSWGLRRPQRFDAVQVESPFLLLTQEDKKRLCW